MPSSAIPGLLVAAPPTLLRQGLLLTLRETWPERPACLTTTAPQLLARLRRQPFALLIIDSAAFAPPVLLPLLRQVRQQHTSLPLLLLTGRRRPPLPPADGAPLRLLPHHSPPAEVARVAAELLRATPPCSPASRSARPAPTAFSPRELEVLGLVLADLCNEAIADQLCVSVRTIESHRRALLQKAGVRTPVGLAVRALCEGWVDLPEKAAAASLPGA